MRVMSANRFERFFRIEARLNVDKTDLKRHNEFINHKIYDLLVRAEAAAKANGRDIIQPFDLPITKGCRSASTSSGCSTRTSSCSPCSTM